MCQSLLKQLKVWFYCAILSGILSKFVKVLRCEVYMLIKRRDIYIYIASAEGASEIFIDI